MQNITGWGELKHGNISEPSPSPSPTPSPLGNISAEVGELDTTKGRGSTVQGYILSILYYTVQQVHKCVYRAARRVSQSVSNPSGSIYDSCNLRI